MANRKRNIQMKFWVTEEEKRPEPVKEGLKELLPRECRVEDIYHKEVVEGAAQYVRIQAPVDVLLGKCKSGIIACH